MSCPPTIPNIHTKVAFPNFCGKEEPLGLISSLRKIAPVVYGCTIYIAINIYAPTQTGIMDPGRKKKGNAEAS